MSGLLIIKPVSAKLKRDTETFGKMDPYCKVRMGGGLQETKVHSNGGKFPAWKDVLTFTRTNESLMTIEIWDKDTFEDDMIGECTVPLTNIIEKKKTAEWFTLSYKGKNAGEVLVEVEWRPDNKANKPIQIGNGAPSMMMAGAHGQPFNPVQAVSYVLPQMYMQQQPQPVYQQQPMMQPVYQQPPVYHQPVQQPQFVQSGFQPQPMMQQGFAPQPQYVQPQPQYVQQPQPQYVQQTQPQYVQPQPQPQQMYAQPQPQPQYAPQPMMQQGYPQQMPQNQGQFYAPPGY